MTIVLCGGGSGGHITPLLAVARELRQSQPKVRLIYIGEKRGKFQHIATSSKLFDEYHFVSAGKLRRYHGESFLRRMFDAQTVFLNIRDIFRLALGTFQAIMLFRKLKADVVLLKGGFVCVPLAIGAHFKGVPSVTHDSDAVPGLSNRIAARWAQYHATAMPARYYRYPAASVKHVGVPVDQRFVEALDNPSALKKKLEIEPDAQVLLVTGGSNGARRLNSAILQSIPDLMDAYPRLVVVHQYGSGNEDQFNVLHEAYLSRMVRFAFSDTLFEWSAVSDIVLTRAGATILADLASQSKACILVPHPKLTGGHQLKNAIVYEDLGAALILQEKELAESPEVLRAALTGLLDSPQRRAALGKKLNATLPNVPAAKALADLLVEAANA
jgi:UDP-N-acetylglucosamine--N-acetylmuramyl-(pentapeptide) pyrophosphoryl-undecaprenol N-acetylglucosamine transferase